MPSPAGAVQESEEEDNEEGEKDQIQTKSMTLSNSLKQNK